MGHDNTRPENSDVDSMTHRESPEWRKAETLRKAEIFGRAAKAFKEFWDQTGDPEAGWRYAHCMRKSGYWESALTTLNELAEWYPLHDDIKQERVWALYEGRLLPAKQQSDSQAVIEAARDMVAAEAEGTALKMAVFAVLAAAKTKGHWKLVSAWCDLLEPAQLDNRNRGTGKGTIPSDRERWYFAKVKSVIHLEDWHVAAVVAEEACREFPNNKNFVRWKANSWAGMGMPREAVNLLGTLRPRIPWYALADMARYTLELEEPEEAWELALEAAAAVGQDSAKVNLWELMARLALAVVSPEAALSHVGLMQAIRNEESWPLRPSHQELIWTVLQENQLSELPVYPVREWKKLCRASWGLAGDTGLNADIAKPEVERRLGRVMGWDPERTFAFLEPDDGGEQIFVLSKDLPTEARENRASVSFRTIKHFDKRKNRESLRAVQVAMV